jgi:hypothetical protein
VITDSTIRISLWSGPRNVSTAMMYAFAQRKDTTVFDEPLYAHYLAHSDAHEFHPGAQDILAAQNNDGNVVVDELLLGNIITPVVFFKNMAHHLVDIDWGFLKKVKNVILIRDPRDMLHSYSKTIPEFDIEDTGYPQLKRICETLIEFGQTPIVMDSKTILEDPEDALTKLCETLGLEFEPGMLNWEAGPKPFEGVWAPHWYHNIHKSTAFQPYQPKTEPFPEYLKPLLDECQPIYDYLIQMTKS